MNLGIVAGAVSVAALWAAMGCSDSDPHGSSIVGGGCDPTDAECGALGAQCSTNLECASGTCVGAACVPDGDVAGAGGNGAGGAGPGSMPGDGSAGTFILVDDLGNGQAGAPDVCVDLEVDFERVTPTVVLLIDQSGSMTQPFDSVGGVPRNRWVTLVETLSDPQGSLIKKLESSVRFGMALYTSQGGFGTGTTPRVCPMLTDVDIALDNFSAVSALLTGNGPSGDTPTAESVAAVAAQLEAFNEDGPKSIILATDGDPDTCEDPNANDDAGSKDRSVAAVTAAFADGIPTHIISVGNQVTASHLKALAVAGAGGDPAAEAFTALNTAALEAAFNQIIGSVRTCDFTLAGTVAASDASRGTVILDGQSLAFGDPNGWEMPDESTVRLVGQACEVVQADASGISMSFPCDAIEIIPR